MLLAMTNHLLYITTSLCYEKISSSLIHVARILHVGNLGYLMGIKNVVFILLFNYSTYMNVIIFG